MAKLTIVGAGPGSPEYVTPVARKAVQEALLVIGAERSLSLFREDIRGETLSLTAKNVDEALKYAVESAKNGKNVSLLSTGDPGFSGLLGSVLKRSLDKTFEITVVAGISSLQACAARLCMSWDNVALFAFHDGTDNKKKRELLKAAKTGKNVLLLPEPKAFSPREIASYLIQAGVDKRTSVVVCENLTLSNEEVIETTLEEASKQNFASLCVMVIKGNLKN